MRTRSAGLAAGVFAAALASAAGPAHADKNERRVSICHLPPGNPDAAHTIRVGDAAVDAHLDHGDFLGSCGGARAGRGVDRRDRDSLGEREREPDKERAERRRERDKKLEERRRELTKAREEREREMAKARAEADRDKGSDILQEKRREILDRYYDKVRQILDREIDRR